MSAPYWPGPLEQTEADGINGDDKQCPGLMGDFGQGFHFFQAAEKVGVLDKHAGGIGIDGRFQVGGRNGSVLGFQGDDFGGEIGQICFQYLAILGMHAFGDNYPAGAAGGVQGHEHGFGCRSAAVVQAGVRHVHAGQLRDERLIFEQACRLPCPASAWYGV